MPASAVIFIAFLLVAIFIVLGALALAWKLMGRHAVDILIPAVVITLFILPFLIWPSTAVYHGTPAYPDKSLGWPLSYIFAQSDADVFGFRILPFLLDLLIGASLGAAFCAWRGYFPSYPRSAEQVAAANP